MIIKPSVKANHPSVNNRTFIRIRITPLASMAYAQWVNKGFTLLGLHSLSIKATQTGILVRSVEGFSSFRQSSVECLAVMGLQTALNLIVIQHQSFNVSVMYSRSLRVPLMAGPLWPGHFFVQYLNTKSRCINRRGADLNDTVVTEQITEVYLSSMTSSCWQTWSYHPKEECDLLVFLHQVWSL